MCPLKHWKDANINSPFFTERFVDEEIHPLTELFPDSFPESWTSLGEEDLLNEYSEHKLELFDGLINEYDVGFYLQSQISQAQPDNVVAKPEPKKRGRPRKNKTNPTPPPAPAPAPAPAPTPAPVLKPADPIHETVPFELSPFEKKKKKRKCMTQVEKAQHNHLERERRKGMTSLLERLRELVPAVSYDKKASQKKIVDEATAYLREQKPAFLYLLKERQRFLSLEKRKRQLENELASKRKGAVLCLWKERRGLSADDLYKQVKRESREDLKDEQMDMDIHVLESYRYRSPESSPSHYDPSSPSSSGDSDDDEEHINVEV